MARIVNRNISDPDSVRSCHAKSCHYAAMPLRMLVPVGYVKSLYRSGHVNTCHYMSAQRRFEQLKATVRLRSHIMQEYEHGMVY